MEVTQKRFLCRKIIVVEPGFKVLFVDDEAEILDLLTYSFTKKGLDVTVAKDGREAFERIQHNRPDLIVLDIMMPELNGIQFCELIRSREEFKDIPVLFLSATSDDLLILSAMTAGGTSFVSKPVRLNVLYDLLVSMYREHYPRVA